MILWSVLLILISLVSVYSQNLSIEENTLIIDDVQGSEIFALGKNVVVKKEAKGVLVFGGDIYIEGRIEGDAAVIGGSIHQAHEAFIGGDVIVIGGRYEAENKTPLRNADKKTVMYAGYEEELREISQNPAQLFAPEMTPAYLAQRLLSLLFWFISAVIITAISPGAVTRAVVRVQLALGKTVGIGIAGFSAIGLFTIMGFGAFPSYLSSIIGIMFLLVMVIAYVFGRVALQAAIGKYIQKTFLPNKRISEPMILLAGALILTILTSLPYLGTIIVGLLFAASLGLVLTSRARPGWQSAS